MTVKRLYKMKENFSAVAPNLPVEIRLDEAVQSVEFSNDRGLEKEQILFSELKMDAGSMSPDALRRCRRMVISSIGEVTDYRRKISIYPPYPDNREITSYVCRTPQDLARIARSQRMKYGIPPENIRIFQDDPTNR